MEVSDRQQVGLAMGRAGGQRGSLSLLLDVAPVTQGMPYALASLSAEIRCRLKTRLFLSENIRGRVVQAEEVQAQLERCRRLAPEIGYAPTRAALERWVLDA